MKLIKMKIKRTQGGGKTTYTYPTPHYDPYKVKYGPIYEGGLNEVVESDIKPRGNVDEYILIGVADEDFAQFMQANNFESDGFVYTAEEIDRTKTLEHGNKWTGPQTEKITDQNKVLQILAKVARKEVLSTEEEDAINPDNLTQGIVKSKSFEEGLDEAIDNN